MEKAIGGKARLVPKHPKTDEDEQDCDIPPETPSAPSKWLVGFFKGIALAKVIGLLSQLDSMHGPFELQNSQTVCVSVSKRTQVLAFLIATSTDPSHAPSIRKRACRFPSASITPTLTAIPISSASILPPER
jgi:hypothetical protein